MRIQYRLQGIGEWITAKSEDSPETNKKKNLLCDGSRPAGCTFDWVVNNQYEKLLSGFKDGLYEVRVKNFCFGGPSLATENVHSYVYDETLLLSTDTVKPMEQTRVSSDERFHGVKFYKAIDCSASTVSVRKINSRCGGAGTASNTLVTPEQLNGYNIKCFKQRERRELGHRSFRTSQRTIQGHRQRHQRRRREFSRTGVRVRRCALFVGSE